MQATSNQDDSISYSNAAAETESQVRGLIK